MHHLSSLLAIAIVSVSLTGCGEDLTPEQQAARMQQQMQQQMLYQQQRDLEHQRMLQEQELKRQQLEIQNQQLQNQHLQQQIQPGNVAAGSDEISMGSVLAGAAIAGAAGYMAGKSSDGYHHSGSRYPTAPSHYTSTTKVIVVEKPAAGHSVPAPSGAAVSKPYVAPPPTKAVTYSGNPKSSPFKSPSSSPSTTSKANAFRSIGTTKTR